MSRVLRPEQQQDE